MGKLRVIQRDRVLNTPKYASPFFPGILLSKPPKTLGKQRSVLRKERWLKRRGKQPVDQFKNVTKVQELSENHSNGSNCKSDTRQAKKNVESHTHTHTHSPWSFSAGACQLVLMFVPVGGFSQSHVSFHPSQLNNMFVDFVTNIAARFKASEMPLQGSNRPLERAMP